MQANAVTHLFLPSLQVLSLIAQRRTGGETTLAGHHRRQSHAVMHEKLLSACMYAIHTCHYLSTTTQCDFLEPTRCCCVKIITGSVEMCMGVMCLHATHGIIHTQAPRARSSRQTQPQSCGKASIRRETPEHHQEL
jgi:hypothetical protein